jgi:hypothetical protein
VHYKEIVKNARENCANKKVVYTIIMEAITFSEDSHIQYTQLPLADKVKREVRIFLDENPLQRRV